MLSVNRLPRLPSKLGWLRPSRSGRGGILGGRALDGCGITCETLGSFERLTFDDPAMGVRAGDGRKITDSSASRV
jgi:hypothetical protein